MVDNLSEIGGLKQSLAFVAHMKQYHLTYGKRKS